MIYLRSDQGQSAELAELLIPAREPITHLKSHMAQSFLISTFHYLWSISQV